MRTSHAPTRLLWATLFGAALVLTGCSKPWLQMTQVPENGYEQTVNYQFQAQIQADEAGTCQSMVVRVRPLNKLYSGGEPPARLQFFDDDCMSPLRFERAQYVAREGGQVRLHGTEVTRFLGAFRNLESELVGWLWREGVI